MSAFIKDPDRHTRGVNAIAAVDGVGNRLRRREAAKIQAMRRRDAALAMVATRAFKASSLGAIPTTGFGKISGRIGSTMNTYQRPDMPTSTTTTTNTMNPTPPRPGGLTYPVVDTRPRLVNPSIFTGLVAQPKGVSLTGGGSIVSGGLVGGSGVSSGSGGLSPTTGSGASSGGLVSGGGGGGGGGGGAWVDPGPGDESDGGAMIDDGSALPADTSSDTNKKYLLYAALALGAYWLWRRSKKGT